MKINKASYIVVPIKQILLTLVDNFVIYIENKNFKNFTTKIKKEFYPMKD